MAALLARVGRGDVSEVVFIVLVIFALVAFGIALRQASQRDWLGTLIAGALGVVLLFVAL